MRALPRGHLAYARNRPKNKMAPLRVSGEAAAPQTPRPKGRPPTGYVWGGDGYVHHDTLLPFSREEHEALIAGLSGAAACRFVRFGSLGVYGLAINV